MQIGPSWYIKPFGPITLKVSFEKKCDQGPFVNHQTHLAHYPVRILVKIYK